VLNALKPPVRAGVQDAQPIELDDGVIVFGVPPARERPIIEKFRKEADTIKAAFAERLGVEPMFKLRAHDFTAPGAFAGASEAQPPPNLDDDVDLTELTDAPDAPTADSVSRLVADLGAEILEERKRS